MARGKKAIQPVFRLRKRDGNHQAKAAQARRAHRDQQGGWCDTPRAQVRQPFIDEIFTGHTGRRHERIIGRS
jgi:hypothetical protein